MSAGGELLDLTVGHQQSTQSRASMGVEDFGSPVGCDPKEIAADFERALRRLLET